MNKNASSIAHRSASEIQRKNATLLALQLWRSERLRRVQTGREAAFGMPVRTQGPIPDFQSQSFPR